MLTVLIIRGATLSGAVEGVKFYMGTVDLAALKNPNVRFIHYFQANSLKNLLKSLGMERSMYTSILCLELLQWWFDCHGIFQ